MVQLRLYLKELKNFLSTVTIKDTMLADSMLTTWVNEEWQEVVANNPHANPYYRALMGDYILFSHSDQLRKVIRDLYDDGRLFVTEPDFGTSDPDEIVQHVLDVLFPVKTKVKIETPAAVWYKGDGGYHDYIYREVPNSTLYRYCNEVPIINSYDDTYKIPFAKEFLFETGIGKELGLRVHSSTSVVYRIPNERYNTLISRCKNEAATIHGIVYPIPIGVADITTLFNNNIIFTDNTVAGTKKHTLKYIDQSTWENSTYKLTTKSVGNVFYWSIFKDGLEKFRSIKNTTEAAYPTNIRYLHVSNGVLSENTVNISLKFDDTSLTNEWNRRKLDVILNADDMSALTYDPKILEQQERQSIIDCVISTLDMIRRRYNIRELGYENLYAPAHYYIIWQILYLAVFVQRIQNIHTGDAHLYHIWNYLKSNGFEDYRDILTLRQQKFLYKNLPYLLKHKGTEHVFEILDYVFFYVQNISLYGKDTIQSTINGEIKTEDTTKKYPSVRSVRVSKALTNGVAEKFNRNSRFEDILHYVGVHAGESVYNDSEEYHYGQKEEIEVLYEKERVAGLEYQDDSLFDRSTTRHTKLLSYSPVSHRNTKMLEIKNNNTLDYVKAMYTKFVGETLLYRIAKENLDFLVEIQLPESAKRIELPIQEWVGLIFYALDQANNTNHAGPPDRFYLSWPYNIDLSDDEWRLPETFMWSGKECRTAVNLATLTSTYKFNDMVFQLSDNRQDVRSIDRFWSDKNGNILRYNERAKRWNIVDRDENVLYRSTKIYDESVSLANLVWFTPDGEEAKYDSKTNMRMIPIDKNYLADFHMPRYNRKMRSAEELAEMLHEQALGFVIMNLEAMQDESAVHRAAYHTIMQQRCIGEEPTNMTEEEIQDLIQLQVTVKAAQNTKMTEEELSEYETMLKNRYNASINPLAEFKIVPVDVNFFGYNKKGTKRNYAEYLGQKAAAIDNLNLVLERYNVETDRSVIYSRMADAIIFALLPEDDPYIPMNVKTSTYRYQKLTELFKSMTAYNLAYIAIQYTDVDSTKLSMNVSADVVNRVTNYITDNFNNNQFDFKLSSVVKQTVKPQYPDQDSVVVFSDEYSADPETDVTIKQTIINNIDSIVDICGTKKLSKTKKHNQLVGLLGEDVTTIVENMSYVKLQNIRNAVHVVKQSHVYDKISIVATDLSIICNDNETESRQDDIYKQVPASIGATNIIDDGISYESVYVKFDQDAPPPL